MNDAALHLHLGAYEGPLDLLLALARSQKVDLADISILALTEQYLAFLQEARSLSLEIAADHLVMAAWLAYLKSCLLLPRDPEVEPSPEELAARLQLRLLRLDAMREAAARLMGRDRLGRDTFVRLEPEGLRQVRKAAWQAGLFDLLTAYARVKARTAPVLHVVAARAVVTLEEALASLSDRVGTALDWTALEQFLPVGLMPEWRPSALASHFVASLELARLGTVELRQVEPFGAVELRRAGP